MKNQLSGADPDAGTVAAARAGDALSSSQLLNKLQLRVFRFILRQAASTQDAEDLTQDTLIEVHRKLHTFHGSARFSTWALGIAQNIVRNYRNRSPVFRHGAASPDLLEIIPDPGGGPHEKLLTQNRMRALQAGLERFLTPELREALTLVSMEGLPYDEAAHVLGIPAGTVKTRVFRARKMLREGLKRAGQLELFTL